MSALLSNLSSDEQRDLKARFDAWALDPVRFVLEVFGPGCEAATGLPLTLDKWQEKGLRGLARHAPHGSCNGSPHKRAAAKAAKGPGKTAWLAWIGWWRMACFSHHQGYCVSITGDNLASNLWKELAYWQAFSPLLMGLFEHKGAEITARDHPKDWWMQARSFPQEADQNQQAQTLAGLHAPNVTILLDEVGGFPMGVFHAATAIFNVKDQDALLAIAGNAVSVDGPLYYIWTEEADRWLLVEITGDPDDPDRSSRIDLEEAREQIRRRGRSDPVVMVNFLGQFPPRSGNKLLGPDDVSRAQRRAPQERLWKQEPLVWGFDVAAGGLDSSVLFARQGVMAFPPDVWRNVTDDALADQVATRYFKAKGQDKTPRKIFIDRGGVGRGVWSRLRALIGGDVVIGVDFGESALDDAQYADRRTEMWCLMSEWVKEVGAIPEIPELRIDLTAPAIGTSQTVHKGTRRKLESKESLKKRGLKSPDHGDGLALTWGSPVFNDAFGAGVSRKAQTEYNPIEYLRNLGVRR